MNLALLGCWGCGIALAVCGKLWAAPSTSFQVAATVTAGCLVNSQVPANGSQVGSFGSLDFGSAPSLSVDTLSTRLNAASAVRLSCTPGVAIEMLVGAGQHGSGGQRYLQLNGGSQLLVYQLYADGGFSDAIAVGQSVAVDTTSHPDQISLPIYARLTLPGALPAGTYTDTLIVTLQW